MTRPTLSAVALLPIRFFFGATFLFAGLDKLVLDPTFFDPSAPTGIQAQLESFARSSPLGDLIQVSLPLAAPIGFLIAVAELGIGIGAITGLAFRVAAVGGAGLSLLLFLTASWAVRPYYLGPDLPYLVGWISLAIAGHGDVLVPGWARTAFGVLPVADASELAPRPTIGAAVDAVVPSPGRRAMLEALALAALAVILASFALPFRALGLIAETPLPTGSPGAGGKPATQEPGATSSAPPVATGGSGSIEIPVATVAQVRAGGGAAAFQVPFSAPAPFPAGDPGIIVQVADGSFVAFDAICTHAGCTVLWDQADALLVCPCHDARFDPAHGAAVVDGPAPSPLGRLSIAVNHATGTISLAS